MKKNPKNVSLSLSDIWTALTGIKMGIKLHL